LRLSAALRLCVNPMSDFGRSLLLPAIVLLWIKR
jgi:hypothetical protein